MIDFRLRIERKECVMFLRCARTCERVLVINEDIQQEG
jgi:hypothetical protein